jgi:hypothetical protein
LKTSSMMAWTTTTPSSWLETCGFLPHDFSTLLSI